MFRESPLVTRATYILAACFGIGVSGSMWAWYRDVRTPVLLWFSVGASLFTAAWTAYLFFDIRAESAESLEKRSRARRLWDMVNDGLEEDFAEWEANFPINRGERPTQEQPDPYHVAHAVLRWMYANAERGDYKGQTDGRREFRGMIEGERAYDVATRILKETDLIRPGAHNQFELVHDSLETARWILLDHERAARPNMSSMGVQNRKAGRADWD